MIEEYFKAEKTACNEEIERYFENLYKREKEVLLGDFISQFKEFITNEKAKRIHPILLTAAFNGIINPMYLEDQIAEIQKVSISIELLHNGYIIYDDIIDNDEIRRSKPAFHVQLMNEIDQVYKNLNIPEKDKRIKLYGLNLGVLGGLMGYSLGMDVIKSSRFPEQLKLLAINEYTEAMDYLMKGEIIEEFMNYHNITMTLEQYLNIAEMQKARLFEKSTKIGAIFAKGNNHYQIKPLGEAMLKIGQAYAIRDDIIDVKEDIKDKKKKFVYIIAVQNTNEEQSKTLNEIYRKDDVNNNDIKQVERIFAETNALVIAEHFSKNLMQESKNLLKDIYPDLNRKQKEFFNEFAEFTYKRDY